MLVCLLVLSWLPGSPGSNEQSYECASRRCQCQSRMMKYDPSLICETGSMTSPQPSVFNFPCCCLMINQCRGFFPCLPTSTFFRRRKGIASLGPINLSEFADWTSRYYRLGPACLVAAGWTLRPLGPSFFRSVQLKLRNEEVKKNEG
ncbi:hypothetical protein F4860DRAFT_79400 [Xylaria cubensis]|nr:hypothetical protein F4860DRAFT_79400 [Xylaria cubensis]